MNLRNWSRQHTLGLLTGLVSPFVFLPVVLFALAWLQDYTFDSLWYKFTIESASRMKFISIGAISNLLWFYKAINQEKYDFAMGVILGTFCFVPFIIYVNYV
jgi:hypothetical protein